MTASEILIDAFGRVQGNVRSAMKGLSEEQLAQRIDPEANSIAWLIWHLARVEDAQIADASGRKQIWNKGWREKFNFDSIIGTNDTGYAHSSEQVAAIRASAKLLDDYYDAVQAQTKTYLESINDEDLEEVIDPGWNPPVTLGVRLASILVDISQHVGQANYARGIILRK